MCVCHLTADARSTSWGQCWCILPAHFMRYIFGTRLLHRSVIDNITFASSHVCCCRLITVFYAFKSHIIVDIVDKLQLSHKLHRTGNVHLSACFWPYDETQNLEVDFIFRFLSVRAGFGGDLPLGRGRHWWHGHRYRLLIGCHRWPRADMRGRFTDCWLDISDWDEDRTETLCSVKLCCDEVDVRVWLKWPTASQDLFCCLMGFNNKAAVGVRAL